MSEKKHIDRIFQEKLKDFEATPSDSVWEHINKRLHEEDHSKRRIIPIWWKLAGVAALLALLLTVGVILFTDNTNSSKIIVDTEEPSPKNSKESFDSNSSKNSTGVENNMDDASNVASEDSYDTMQNGSSNGQKTNNSSELNKAHQNRSSTPNVENDRIVSNVKDGSQRSISSDKVNPNDRVSGKNIVDKTKNAVVDASSKTNNNSSDDKLNTTAIKEKSEVDKLLNASKNENPRVTDASEKMEEILEEDKKQNTEEQSIEDAIAQTNNEEEKDEKEKKLNRWNISPNVAPVYFNSLGKGSAIDEQFVNNSTEGEVTMSYGVGGSYAINDRLKVRAGINKVSMGYNTNNVIAFNRISPSATEVQSVNLSNVSMNSASEEGIVYMSTQNMDNNKTPEIINVKSNGSLNQRFGFIEIPMEVEYALSDKKLGINLIGGFSTLFVDENEVYSVVDGVETRIGEANNINNMSYSANFGLGINYNISEKVKVNVEPTFKYQINTFNNSSGNFQPYFIGVYTGLSYKF